MVVLGHSPQTELSPFRKSQPQCWRLKTHVRFTFYIVATRASNFGEPEMSIEPLGGHI